MIRKIDRQNAEALVRQRFAPMLKMIADYEAGKNPDKWRQDEKLVNLFGHGTNLEAVIEFIVANYEQKPKARKTTKEVIEDGSENS